MNRVSGARLTTQNPSDVTEYQKVPTVIDIKLDDLDDVVVPGNIIRAMQFRYDEVVGYLGDPFGHQCAVLKIGPSLATLYILIKGSEAKQCITCTTPNLLQSSYSQAKGKARTLVSLQAVVWNIPKRHSNVTSSFLRHKRRQPTVACLVRWGNNDGKYIESWETRSTLKRHYPPNAAVLDDKDYVYNGVVILARGTRMSEPDKAIVVCAIKSWQAYLEYATTTHRTSNYTSMTPREFTKDWGRLKQLPPELWISVIGNLSPFDTLRYIYTNKDAKSFVGNSQLQHMSVWRLIFRDDVWINKVISHGIYPVLLGHRISSLHEGLKPIETDGDNRSYIALVLARANEEEEEEEDKSTNPEAFLQSLRSDSFSLENMEVEYPNFILNVCDIFEPDAAIDLPQTRQLYAESAGNAYTTVAYYIDSTFAMYNVKPVMATERFLGIQLPHLDRSVWAFRSRKYGTSLATGLRRVLGRPLGSKGIESVGIA